MFPHHRVDEQPHKKPKKSFQNGKGEGKGAAAMVKNCTTIGLRVSQESGVIITSGVGYRGNPGLDVLGSIRRVRFTQSALRQAGIGENKGPSLAKIQGQNSSSAKSLRCDI